MAQNLPASTGDARDTGLIPGLGGSPGEGNGNPLQYSCLENPMGRRAWWATWGQKGSDTTEHSRASLPINGPALAPDHLVFFQNCKGMAYTDKSFTSSLNLISESWFLWHLYQGLYLVLSSWPWITNRSPTLMASASSFHETIIIWTLWLSPGTEGWLGAWIDFISKQCCRWSVKQHLKTFSGLNKFKA